MALFAAFLVMAGGSVAAFMIPADASIYQEAQKICGLEKVKATVVDVVGQAQTVATIFVRSTEAFAVVNKDSKALPKLQEISHGIKLLQVNYLRYDEIIEQYNIFVDSACQLQNENNMFANANFVRAATAIPFKVLILGPIDMVAGGLTVVTEMLPHISLEAQEDVFATMINDAGYTKEIVDAIRNSIRNFGIQ
jgi:hypothetical protein